ncbi:MAG: ATP-grasp domain-containing protein [Candidatus Woesearchaeota archaeon]|nr:ATP-grasp domain-containing protein [Candidatus Woesearchaeota archaeon]
MKIALLYCGKRRPESIKDVYYGLCALGHTPQYVMYDQLEKDLSVLKNFELVFNRCQNRREPTIIARLEHRGLVVTGNSAETASICGDKQLVAEILRKETVPIPGFAAVNSLTDLPEVAYPCIIKPADEHASNYLITENVVHDSAALRLMVREMLKIKKTVLVERFIEGREFFVPLLWMSKTGTLGVPAFFEVVFSERFFKGLPRILSHEVKWNRKDPRYYGLFERFDHHLPPSLEKAVKDTAITAGRALGCRGYASVNIRMDAQNNLFVIDVNPNCDISLYSDFSIACYGAGIAYPEMLERIIEHAQNQPK